MMDPNSKAYIDEKTMIQIGQIKKEIKNEEEIQKQKEFDINTAKERLRLLEGLNLEQEND